MTAGKPDIRATVIQKIVSDGDIDVSDDFIDECTVVQSAFVAFRQSFESASCISAEDKIFSRYSIAVDQKTIVFDCLNSAWISTLGEEPGRLTFPFERYKKLHETAVDLRIAVLHHPLNWYSQNILRPFRAFLRGSYNIILSGHEHTQGAGIVDDYFDDRSAYFEGGVLQPHGANADQQSEFNLMSVDMKERQFLSLLYSWDGKMYVESRPDSSWSGYQRLPEKRDNQIEIKPSFLDTLQNPGASFSVPGRPTLKLHDVFVYPDMRSPEGEAEHDRKVFNTSSLRNVTSINEGLVIRGEDNVGKTSLLFQLYLQYHDLGLVPLYITCADLDTAVEQELDKLLRRAIDEQYGAGATQLFLQEPRKRKVLLLDDLDQIALPHKHRAKALQYLIARFGTCLVTASELFEMSDVLSTDVDNPMRNWDQYSILPFGYKLRYQLVKRWADLGHATAEQKRDLQVFIDSAEKTLNTVIGRNYVPSVPFYLLTLLQSFESAQSSDLENSAFGHYYHFLIVKSLLDVGVRADRYDEYFSYCSQLAWAYRSSDCKELSEQELRDFNQEFSRSYIVVEFKDRLTELVNANILRARGKYYSFAYPYLYYYFLGKYLAEHITEVAVRALVDKCCQHLYLRDYANTVLFLTHHSKDQYVYDRILIVLRQSFGDKEPLKLEDDTQALNKLVNEAPKLVYAGGDVEQHRERARELRDDTERNRKQDNEASAEINGELDKATQLSRLFKTAEILGQLLKNHYGSLHNNIKTEITDAIFDGGMRALRDFIDQAMVEHETLIERLAELIEKHEGSVKDESTSAQARKIVFNWLGVITFMFITKTASCVNSDYLHDVVRATVRAKETNAKKLIEMSVRLESAAAIPFDEIGKLCSTNSANLFVKRLLQMLVLGHLYMYKTSDADKQRICEILDIDMKFQRMIDDRGRGVKRHKS